MKLLLLLPYLLTASVVYIWSAAGLIVAEDIDDDLKLLVASWCGITITALVVGLGLGVWW